MITNLPTQHPIPLSLYMHIPWCVKKCPYCDFNSHALKTVLPEKEYCEHLLYELETQLPAVQNRIIHSIFIGGGTPSLFSPSAYQYLFSQLRKMLTIPSNCEITLEANPGTIENEKFKGYFDAGINRISLGVQSFQNDKLALLGRIHDGNQARNAIYAAKCAGFSRINVDLMFGLPNQTIDEALLDLQTAVDCDLSHVSWYQLTLEPNTFFYRFPPDLPNDDIKFEMQEAGQALLRKNQLIQYEISAYAKTESARCHHNLNYWRFGDYLGIGAGAHAKLTDAKTSIITRRMSTKHPKQYLSAMHDALFQSHQVASDEISLEFMMNALRLFEPIPFSLFEQRTGHAIQVIKKSLMRTQAAGLLDLGKNYFCPTPLGYRFLNELLMIFSETNNERSHGAGD